MSKQQQQIENAVDGQTLRQVYNLAVNYVSNHSVWGIKTSELLWTQQPNS